MPSRPRRREREPEPGEPPELSEAVAPDLEAADLGPPDAPEAEPDEPAEGEAGVWFSEAD